MTWKKAKFATRYKKIPMINALEISKTDKKDLATSGKLLSNLSEISRDEPTLAGALREFPDDHQSKGSSPIFGSFGSKYEFISFIPPLFGAKLTLWIDVQLCIAGGRSRAVDVVICLAPFLFPFFFGRQEIPYVSVGNGVRVYSLDDSIKRYTGGGRREIMFSPGWCIYRKMYVGESLDQTSVG